MVAPDAFAPFAFASHAYPDFHLLMPLYVATRWSGTPKPDPDAAQAIAWAHARDLQTYEMPPADIILVERLMERDASK